MATRLAGALRRRIYDPPESRFPDEADPPMREPLTIKLLWATLACMLLTLLPDELLSWLVQWPLRLGATGGFAEVLGNFMPWQLATHVLVNSMWTLILFVAPTLWFFGGQLESMWGARRYGLFLLASALGSGVIVLVVSSAAVAFGIGGYAPASGAYGMTYAILFALAYITPYQEVRLMLPPVSMQMRTMAIVFGVISFVSGVKFQGLWIHVGFLGGMLVAWLHIRYWRGLPPFGRRPSPPKSKPRHLRSV
jgi:membrane associated rhomboid family serine protease